MTCAICHGEGRVKVGWSTAPSRIHGIRVEYDPCPECTPAPHTFHARQTAAHIKAIHERDTA